MPCGEEGNPRSGVALATHHSTKYWYQIILLGNRGTCVLTTCPGLHSTAGQLGFEPTTYWLQVRHSTTTPLSHMHIIDVNFNVNLDWQSEVDLHVIILGILHTWYFTAVIIWKWFISTFDLLFSLLRKLLPHQLLLPVFQLLFNWPIVPDYSS